MYNHEPIDYDCPLCKLVKGGGTGVTDQDDIIYQDELITSFIAGKWWYSNPGHAMIIPNKHFENIYDIDEQYLEHVHKFSKKLAIAIRVIYKSDGTSIRQHNEPAGNQDVWHYHLHVFPRYKDDHLYQNHDKTKWPTKDEKKPYTDRLKKYFDNNGKKK